MIRKRFLSKSPPPRLTSSSSVPSTTNNNDPPTITTTTGRTSNNRPSRYDNNIMDLRPIEEDHDNVVTTTGDYDATMIPTNEIHRRTLHPYSIHASPSGWTATLRRPDCGNNNNNNMQYGQNMKYFHYTFPTEREARQFCKAYSPPKYHSLNLDENTTCMVCATTKMTYQSLSNHCRNCGVVMCELCTRRWGIRMIPRTYHYSNGQCNTKYTVRVCKSCDWLSNAFCLALLQGRYHDALTLYGTVG
jgi:hypothetical protein